MRKIAAVFLALIVLGGLCCYVLAMGREAALYGTWEHHGYYDGDAIMEVFVHMDLYEEEIALMDPAGIGYVETITFRPDGTYTISCDTAASTALAEEYYRNAMEAFYENRETLGNCYGVSFSIMTRENFFQFYSQLYGVEDYEALIDMFTETTVDPEYLSEGEENGTYRVTPRRIYCTIEGEEEAQYVPYTLEDGALTLGFYQWELTYSRRESE